MKKIEKPEETYADVGNRLQRIRLYLGYKTQVEFAKFIGVGSSTYNSWERGYRFLHPNDAIRHFKSNLPIHISLDFLYTGDIRGLNMELLTSEHFEDLLPKASKQE